jgi:hypothetical protein
MAAGTMFIATLLAVLFSAFAFGVSLYTLWVVRVSPYRLLAYPPALAYLNRKESSLVLDLTFFNPGRVRVAVLDMEITLWSRNQQGIAGELKPQAYHQTLFPQGSLSERHSIISRFTPFMIKQQETISKTVYFAAGDQDSGAGLRSGNDPLDRISIAFKINSRWNKKTFGLDYAEFQAFQHNKERSTLLKLPFSPSFFPDAKPLELRGSIFDPVS